MTFSDFLVVCTFEALMHVNDQKFEAIWASQAPKFDVLQLRKMVLCSSLLPPLSRKVGKKLLKHNITEKNQQNKLSNDINKKKRKMFENGDQKWGLFSLEGLF